MSLNDRQEGSNPLGQFQGILELNLSKHLLGNVQTPNYLSSFCHISVALDSCSVWSNQLINTKFNRHAATSETHNVHMIWIWIPAHCLATSPSLRQSHAHCDCLRLSQWTCDCLRLSHAHCGFTYYNLEASYWWLINADFFSNCPIPIADLIHCQFSGFYYYFMISPDCICQWFYRGSRINVPCLCVIVQPCYSFKICHIRNGLLSSKLLS